MTTKASGTLTPSFTFVETREGILVLERYPTVGTASAEMKHEPLESRRA